MLFTMMLEGTNVFDCDFAINQHVQRMRRKSNKSPPSRVGFSSVYSLAETRKGAELVGTFVRRKVQGPPGSSERRAGRRPARPISCNHNIAPIPVDLEFRHIDRVEGFVGDRVVL